MMENIWPESVSFTKLENINHLESWKEPEKQIFNQQDVSNFQKSVALSNLQQFLFKICSLISDTAVPGGILDDTLVSLENAHDQANLAPPPNSVIPELKKEVQAVLSLLQEFDSLIQSYPPLPGPRRYGNMACRSWHDELNLKMSFFLDRHLAPLYHYENFEGFKKECKHYILGSFGSRQRLDFGTGHELAYLAFLNSLIMCGILDADTITGQDMLIIFCKYYDLVKKLILTYTLEPAGTHGVWGLDDHFHLIYILGSAQFVDYNSEKSDHSRMVPAPSSILKAVTLQKYRTSNLYFNAISFIRKVKSGPFNEHSPILYDVSAVKSWKKVNQGMIKMWFVEVLSKFPVVQHFYFGNVLYPWKDLNGNELPRSTESNKNRADEEKMQAEIKLANASTSANFVPTAAPWANSRAPPEITPSTGRESKQSSRQDSVVTKAPWAK